MNFNFLKILIFASLIAAAGSTYACPDLTGQYLCKQNASHAEMLYSFNRVQNGTGWEYWMDADLAVDGTPVASYNFLADGVEREAVDAVSGQKLLLKADCTADVLQVTGTTNIPGRPTPVRFSELLSLTPAGDLLDVSIDINGATIEEICTQY